MIRTSFQPLVRDTTKTTINHSPMLGKAMPEYVTLTIPAFTVPEFNWPTGASIIVTEFRYTSTAAFSILKPLIAPASVNHCLAIRWEVGGEVVRYKLWEDVDEDLHYPLYNSELIPIGEFVIEVWTVTTSTSVSSTTGYLFLTTMTSTVAETLTCTCTRASGLNINLTETCELFTPMLDRAVFPFVFDTCLSAIPFPGYLFTLTWNALPKDLDLHMLASINGVSYHVWYSLTTKGDQFVYPYIQLDRDDTDGYGPESIIVRLLCNPGTYHLYVNNYEDIQGHTGDLWTSGAILKVYDYQRNLVDTINVPVVGTGKYWDILTIVDGVFTTINVIQAAAPTL